MAPVSRALAARGLPPRVVLTGQQPLDPAEFALGSAAALLLECPGRPDPDAHARAVAGALALHFVPPPDLILVHGDTSSALGAAIAARRAGSAIGHVEAGLRTHDLTMPWPEEGYRVAIDSMADLLFAPTSHSAANLDAENVGGEIIVTGNSGIDAFLDIRATLPPQTLRERDRPIVLVTCHRRENWGDRLASVAEAIAILAADGIADFEIVLPPNSFVAAETSRLLLRTPGVRLLNPLPQRDLIVRMRDCNLMLSDSGGIQEEACALGTPLLILRDKTERPEGIATGNMMLVGSDRDRIVGEVRRLLGDPVQLAAMSRPSLPFGDGRSAPRIAAAVEDWLGRRGRLQKIA